MHAAHADFPWLAAAAPRGLGRECECCQARQLIWFTRGPRCWFGFNLHPHTQATIVHGLDAWLLDAWRPPAKRDGGGSVGSGVTALASAPPAAVAEVAFHAKRRSSKEGCGSSVSCGPLAMPPLECGVLLNSDEQRFGGLGGHMAARVFASVPRSATRTRDLDRSWALEVIIPPLAACVVVLSGDVHRSTVLE